MRKWTLASAGVLAIGLAFAAGQQTQSGTKAEAPKGPAAAKNGQPGKTAPTVAPQPKTARSRVVKVTVYPSNALVTREVEVPAGNGLAELVVTELPQHTVDTSLYSEGTEGIRVLSTRYRQRPVLEDTREDVRKLEDEKQKLRLKSEKLAAEMATIRKNMELLGKLENFTAVTTVHTTKEGGLNGDTVIAMAKYVMEQRAEKAKEEIALKQQLETIKEQVTFLDRKLADLTAGSTRIERDAIVIVDRENGGGIVRLNYLVNRASWHPQYKLRAGATAKEQVQLDFLAGLTQQTGEDWRNVDLTLSTAQPMLNAAPPQLAKLAVTVTARASLPGGVPGAGAGPGGFGGGRPGMPAPEPFAPQAPADLEKRAKSLRGQAGLSYNNFDVGNATKQINEAAALEQARDLMKSREQLFRENSRNPMQQEAQANADGPSVTYHLKTRLTVPSRPDEQVIEVAKLKMEPKYYYKAVPVLARHVYRLADLTNKSPYVLLPGEATMYQGTDFVGRMTMPLVAIGEEFTAGFGVDPQLQIQRQMVDKAKATQGGNQVLKYEYRILVSSYKKEPVKLQVWDRLPHAETETAGITLVKSTPEISKDGLYQREDRPNNLLRWDLDVEPNRNGERAMTISYEFRLELDRNMAITGLLSR